MNSYFEQLLRQTSVRLAKSETASGIGRREEASWKAEPLEVQESQLAPVHPHPSKPYDHSRQRSDVPKRSATAHRQNRSQHPEEPLADEIALTKQTASKSVDHGTETPRPFGEQVSSNHELAHERERIDRSEAAGGEKADPTSPQQTQADDETPEIRPGEENANPEQRIDDTVFRQQWWEHAAQVRQWVAESDEPDPDPSDMIRNRTPIAVHLPGTPHDQPERYHRFPEESRDQLPESAASENVKLSIGSIQLTVEAPEPSPPAPAQIEPKTDKSNGRTTRLSRHYLRR